MTRIRLDAHDVAPYATLRMLGLVETWLNRKYTDRAEAAKGLLGESVYAKGVRGRVWEVVFVLADDRFRYYVRADSGEILGPFRTAEVVMSRDCKPAKTYTMAADGVVRSGSRESTADEADVGRRVRVMNTPRAKVGVEHFLDEGVIQKAYLSGQEKSYEVLLCCGLLLRQVPASALTILESSIGPT